MKKVAAVTFGCKVNQYETACILEEFNRAGYATVNYDEPADVYIINSCTVTNRTDQKSRNALRKALRSKEKNPNVKVVITGCYAQINHETLDDFGDIDLIVDNNKKGKILDLLQIGSSDFEDIFSAREFAELSTTDVLSRSRAFVKVQDGCNYFCSYCTVPYGRGNPRSRDPENVLKQIEVLIENGYHEFVLGGINLGLYGLEKKNGFLLPDLIRDIASISGVEIIRLSSIEPQLFTDKLLQQISDNKTIAPHFHIPLQSGTDEILKSMNRRYNTAEFSRLLNQIIQIRPSAAIGLDVIAGLPGETEELFNRTLSFIKDLPITYLHVFSYSVRSGTEAAGMSGQVKGDVIRVRSNKLTNISNLKKQVYLENLISQKLVLKGILEKKIQGYWTALSDHYIRMYVQTEDVCQKDLYTGYATDIYSEGILVK